MLILTRRVGEVTVTVLGVKGNQVRIGVNAPKEVAVHREEIYDRIKREQETSHVASDNSADSASDHSSGDSDEAANYSERTQNSVVG